MKQSILKRSLSGAGVGVLAFGFTLVTNLLQVTLLLSFWSQEQYGHWLLLLSAATMATALDSGHQLYIGNQLNREQIEDPKKMLVSLGSAVRVAALLGLLQIIILSVLVVSGWLFRIIGLHPDDAPGFSYGLLAYTILWVGTGSIGSILVRLFIPAGYYVRSTLWNLATRACQLIVLAALVYQQASFFVVALTYGLVPFVIGGFVFWDLKRLLPEYWPWWQSGSLKIGFANFFRSSIYVFTNLLDNVSQQGVLIIITHGLGTFAVPLFTTLRTVANMAMQGGGFLLNPVTPDIVRLRVTEQYAKLIGVFKMYWLALTFFMNLGLLFLFVWVEPLYNLWTKGKLVFDTRLFLWLAIAVVFRSLGLPFLLFLQSLNRIYSQIILSCVRLTMCIAGSILLVHPLGLSGVAFAVAFSELLASLILPCCFFLKELRGITFHQLNMGWALIGTGATSSLLALFSLDWINSFQLTLAGFIVSGYCTYKQWQHTDLALRLRLLSSLPTHLHYFFPGSRKKHV